MGANYASDGTLGIDLDRVDAASTSGFAAIGIGAIVRTIDGGLAMYVEASAELVQYNVVAIQVSASTHKATAITTALGSAADIFGVAQTSITSGSFGWVHLEGTNLQVNVAVSCDPAEDLYITATAGVLDDNAAASTVFMKGIKTLSTAVTATNVPCVVRGLHMLAKQIA